MRCGTALCSGSSRSWRAESLSDAVDSVSGMEIRPATAADAARIAQVWESAWRDGHVGHIPDELLVHRQSDSFETRTAAMIDRTHVAELSMARSWASSRSRATSSSSSWSIPPPAAPGVAAALLADGRAAAPRSRGTPSPGSRSSPATRGRATSTSGKAGGMPGTSTTKRPIEGGTVTVSCRRYELIRED